MTGGPHRNSSKSARTPPASHNPFRPTQTETKPASPRKTPTRPPPRPDHIKQPAVTTDLGSEGESRDDETSESEFSSDEARMAQEEDDASTPTEAGYDGQREESERLRLLKEAVDNQMRAQQERARIGIPPLTHRTSSGGGLQARRFSPIKEETSASPGISPSLEEAFPSSSPLPTGGKSTVSTDTTDSTESGRTIRGSVPPTPGSTYPLRTPSYPFPYVPGTPRTWSSSFHHPFTTLSPTVSSMNVHDHTPGDRTASEVSTPAASAIKFMPSVASPIKEQDNNEEFPQPNLYDLTIELGLEPGLHAWWQTAARILGREYGAIRASLAIPADAGDLENVPWGQIATYNAAGPPPSSSDNAAEKEGNKEKETEKSSHLTLSTPLRGVHDEDRGSKKTHRHTLSGTRPSMVSRHSYAGFEKDRAETTTPTPSTVRPERPAGLNRTKTYAPSTLSRSESVATPSFSISKYSSGSTPGFSSTLSDLEFSSIGTEAHIGPYTAMLPSLQGLGYEDHALINSTYVNRIIQRGKVVALTREYSSELPAAPAAPVRTPNIIGPSPGPAMTAKEPGAQTFSKASLHLEGSRNKLKLPKDYFTHEPRAPPTLPTFEEFEQFPSSPWAQSPAPSPAIQADPEENPFFAVGDAGNVDESSFNPRDSTPDFKNSRSIEAIGVDRASTVIHIPLIHPTLSQQLPPSRKTSEDRGDDAANESDQIRKAPIAILSLLSPVVPYPQPLLHSLKLLAAHLAISFGMAQQYTNAQRQASSILHRRAGHRVGFAPFQADREGLEYLMGADIEPPASVSGSITSPSDYSGRSRTSPGASIIGTPSWDTSSVILGRRSTANTPSQIAEQLTDSYFDSTQRSPITRSRSNTGLNRMLQEDQRPAPPRKSEEESRSLSDSRRRTTSMDKKSSGPAGRLGHASNKSSSGSSISQAPERAERKHSYLHSYGADFATSFQMLPSTATPGGTMPGIPASAASAGQDSGMKDMLPPSERLLRTIIDALPVQIFTAAPITGVLTWVNSKFVAYRGKEPNDIIQDPWQAIHANDRAQYMEQWQQSLSTGSHFSHKVRLRRFDNVYRWFFVRATPLKDKKQNIVHWTGTYMDIHEQHVAEQNAAQQAETEASEAKYRALANSSPQIVFAATRTRGVTFCNSQWLNYSGQTEAQARALGFMDLVHPDDLSKCKLPVFNEDGTVAEVPTTLPLDFQPVSRQDSSLSSDDSSETNRTVTSPGPALTPTSQLPQARLSKLASDGILKVSRDSDGRPSYSTEVRLKNKDGEFRWHLVRVLQAEPVRRDDDDEEETWYGTCTDINDHKLLEQTLKDTMDAKSRFLSNMSHEIRTPLNGITGMVNFLLDASLTQEQLEHVHIIRNSTEGLRDLINDILDLSKVEAGMITLQMEWFHIRSLIEEINDLIGSMAMGKGLELNYLIADNVPSNVKGDRFRIRQVLLNVIGNAIKFTQEGEVFVKCEVATDEQADLDREEAMIRFTITDTGGGFTPEEAEFLFKRFSQIDSSSTKQHGGTGLGLAISKQLVQLHGGDMDARSVPGKGATFFFHAKFSLPSVEDHPPTRVGTPLPSTAITPGAVPPKRPLPLPSTWSPKFSRTDSDNSSSSLSPAPLKHEDSIGSSGSSDPSIRTARTSVMSARSSTSSFASVPSPPMNLEMPTRPGLDLHASRGGSSSADSVSTTSTVRPRKGSSAFSPGNLSPGTKVPAPPPVMFSILVICPLTYAREAIVRHIETTIPQNSPHHITAPEDLEESKKLLGLVDEGDPVIFTHVVIISKQSSTILEVANCIFKSSAYSSTSLLIISDLNQRREIDEQFGEIDYKKLNESGRLHYLSKPLKPSKFAVIFDPQKSREFSTDRSQDSAQAVVMNQKQVFEEMKRRLGMKGVRVLLVEDNKTNQMVLQKFLKKVEIEVETVLDGVECTDAVFKYPHDHYSIILCDLHMPNKDGYQTCREIRKWERKNKVKPLPIIALSANVLGDVYAKCAEAGFNSYVTKPVDFKELSIGMLKYLDPEDPSKPIEFMSKKR